MHVGQVDTGVDIVRHLIRDSFPEWSDRDLVAVEPCGTVNAVYRLGEDLCVRLPIVETWARDLEKELAWLPKLRPHLPLHVPTPLGTGRPTDRYPFTWAVYRWLPGAPYADEVIDDERGAAEDLAAFVTELQAQDTTDAPLSTRCAPLALRDAGVQQAFTQVASMVDVDALSEIWQRAVAAEPWDAERWVWTHGDLLRPNLLACDGDLTAVIDFGNLGIGDPAVDAAAAWSVFGPAGRRTFRERLAIDDNVWGRARALALHQALLVVPYYAETNPAFVTIALRTLETIAADDG